MKPYLRNFISQVKRLAQTGRFEELTNYIVNFLKKYGTVLSLSTLLMLYILLGYLIIFHPGLSNAIIKKIMEWIKERIKQLS